jgi:hypothetical protein
MTEHKERLSPRSEAAKQFVLDKRDLTAKESEAQRLASVAHKTARLRELRLSKEAAEHEATIPSAKPKRGR